MRTHQAWATKLTTLTLGTALVCVPGTAFAGEEFWVLDGEGILGDAPQDDTLLAEEAIFNERAAQAEELTTLQVNARSQEEIKALFKATGLNLAQPVTYEQVPDVAAPFSAGQLSEETITQAAGLLNLYRFVAGLDASVIPNAEYGKQSQAAALLMAVDEDMSHWGLAHPDGMSDELYELGASGCASSNIAAGYLTLQDAIMGWVDDSSSNNIASVGHRRWILNPSMGQTGFGAVSAVDSPYNSIFSAMYAFDNSNSEALQTMVAWPANNTPVELFGLDTPWSISFDSMVDEASVHVQVKSLSSGKVWNFSSNSADGDFYVSNAYYGSLAGCVIFRPNDIDMSAGQSYEVTVTGVDTPVQYRVSFFYVTDELTSIAVNSKTLQSNEYGVLVPSVTVKAGDETLVEDKDYYLSIEYGSDMRVTVTATGINNYHGTVSTSFTPDNSNGGHVTVDKDNPQLPGRWVSSQGKWWYQYIDGTFPANTWSYINGKWYFFNSEGWMQTGWQQIDGKWYYLNSSGAMQIGWQKVGGSWYYLKSNGVMATGWQSIGGTWYYLNASGRMQTGWQQIEDMWYYLNSSGAMQTGWYKVGSHWYYSNASGVMQSNRWIGNYYVTASGAMAANTWIGKYHVNDSGLWDETA